MSDQPRQLLHYSLTRKLGEGGMGEVWQATDNKLGREVAVKLMPEPLAGSPERLARFEREAKVLASLNHPHVATLHGFEREGDHLFLVMELVEGQDLAETLASGPLPVDEALQVAAEVAAGLATAHDRGVIHRDLKPANIKRTPDGHAKVLDFGLAKALLEDPTSSDGTPSLSASPTITTGGTRAGVILGTAAYMSPEQAVGRPVDRRSDVFSFGSVLYEMLTGRRAFPGETVTETMAAVVRDQPDLDALPGDTPPAVRRLLRRCFAKKPADRLRDMADVRLLLLEAAAGPVEEDAASAAPSRPGRLLPALAAVTLIALGLAAWGWLRPVPQPEPVSLSIALDPGEEIVGSLTISDDGRTVAYVSGKGDAPPQLWLRDLDDFVPRAIPGSENARSPFFSPDGRSIAFFAEGELRVASVSGGQPRRLASAPSPFGGTWSEDGTIVFTATLNSGLMAVPADGGEPEVLTTPDFAGAGYAHTWPQFLPGGREVLFSIWPGMGFGSAVLSLDDRTWRIVVPGTSGARYASSGHLLVPWDAGTQGDLAALHAAPFRPGQREEVGALEPVLTGVYALPWTVRSWFAVSQNGHLAYAPGNIAERTLVWVDEEGTVETASEEQQPFVHLSLSPDGTRVAYKIGFELWVEDLRDGTRVRLTDADRNDSATPVWDRDGRRLYFNSNRDGNWDIFVRLADGSAPAEPVLSRPGWQAPLAVAPDGTLLLNHRTEDSSYDLYTLSPDGAMEPLVATEANETDARPSPDGDWIAYTSNESGRDEVYVRRFDGAGKRLVVSTQGGAAPLWSDDGRSLYYMNEDVVWAASLTFEPEPRVVSRRALFEGKWEAGFVAAWSRGPDGRFLLIRRDAGSIPDRIHVVLDWLDRFE